MSRIFYTLAGALFFATAALAKIIRVPADQPTVQAAINAATKGDTVLVADGTYYENINFKGKAITVASHFLVDRDKAHIAKTIINGSKPSYSDTGSVVLFVSKEDTNSVLCGFTITGGTGTAYEQTRRGGGGIFGYYAGARICHNRIENNQVLSTKDGNIYGGGVFVGPITSKAFAIVEDNTIQFNKASGTNRIVFGGGICLCVNGRIVKNQISRNEAEYAGTSSNWYCLGGGISGYSNTFIFVRISDNIITDNSSTSTTTALSGGVDLTYTNSDFSNNFVSNNSVKGR